MKYIYTIVTLFVIITSVYCSSSRNYTFDVDKLNEELDNIYNLINDKSTKTRYLTISASEFQPSTEVADFQRTTIIKSGSNTVLVTYYAPVQLPHGSIITSLTGYWYRDDALASGSLTLYQLETDETVFEMAAADSNATTGYHSASDTSISSSTINNSTYLYYLKSDIDPNNSNDDVGLVGAKITYTVINKLP